VLKILDKILFKFYSVFTYEVTFNWFVIVVIGFMVRFDCDHRRKSVPKSPVKSIPKPPIKIYHVAFSPLPRGGCVSSIHFPLSISCSASAYFVNQAAKPAA